MRGDYLRCLNMLFVIIIISLSDSYYRGYSVVIGVWLSVYMVNNSTVHLLASVFALLARDVYTLCA